MVEHTERMLVMGYWLLVIGYGLLVMGYRRFLSFEWQAGRLRTS